MTRGKIGTGKYSKVVRHIPWVTGMRKFSGKNFHFRSSHRLKKNAKRMAMRLRKTGNNARVIPAPKSWKTGRWFVYMEGR